MKPAANHKQSNQKNQKSSALASLKPCTVEVGETDARKGVIGSLVGSGMACFGIDDGVDGDCQPPYKAVKASGGKSSAV